MGIRIDELPALTPSRSAIVPAMSGGTTGKQTLAEILGLAVAGDVGFTPGSASALTGETIEEVVAELEALIAALTTGKQAAAANLSTLAGLASVSNLSTLAALASVVNLSALAGLTGAADKGIRFTGVGTMAVFDQTSFGRTLAGLANAAALRGAAELADGSWTPTVTGVTNVASVGSIEAGSYTRIGGTVHFVGAVTLTPTAGSLTQTTFRASLPVASTLASGRMRGHVTTPTSGAVGGDTYVGGGMIEGRFRAGGTGGHVVVFSGQYEVTT